ncbi:TonB-dependent receptor plug domain-containing protein [Flavobacteriaceae bacterium TP-CH-4]|uniref:TonB-dependent receptor plug domain-containing protein n=1 Tax=Pelagihabitans pacificus TaxID=2696054 RepID=A0A967ATY1_9FLAO|nr:carboxypeptidase regulatory-like domain-containing protein [Pelagihabitans pacificus]NHF59345.1 TonB-dependent receptor plug domain-containing protein [Pelagihabitans pacificus]
MKKILPLIVFSFMCLASYAQTTTANVKGTVSDDQGEPLFGANIVAVHTPTGTKYGAISNEDGRFNLLNLRVGGPYEITISYVGFRNQTRDDVFLTLGKTFNVDVQLVSESQVLDEVVVVSDQGGTFGSDRTGAETSVGRRELTRLPTISRSASDFIRLDPSASSGASGLSFGGRNDQYNNFSLDGAIFNNPFGLDAATPGGQTNAQPISLDAIDQIQVTTAPYDVTQAGFTGASVNAVTKSGTNEFYGTVYGFFRNDDLTGGKIDGDDVFKTGLEQKQYGFSVGGPIVKNKLFFFMNFERDELTELGTDGFVPNRGTGAINESRVLASDFELVDNLLRQVVIGQNAQGNDIFYNPGRFEGFNFDQESTKGIIKLDWNINDKNRLALIYNFLNASKGKPANRNAIAFRGPNTQTLQFENAGYEINNNIQSVQVELNSTVSDEATNKLQVGYTHFDDFRNPFSTPAPSIQILDATGSSSYIIAGHEPFSINNRLDQKVFQITDNFNIFKGNHTYTIGFSFEKFQFDNSFNLGAYGAQGVFFPTTTITDFPEFAASGQLQEAFDTAIAANRSFEANGTGNPGGWALAETNVGQLSFYLQDQWDATENFKLTYGVRFDRPLYFDTAEKIRENIERKGGANGTYIPSIEYFDPDTGEGIFLDSEQLPSTDWLISPRVGFNWDMNGDKTLQIRGGSGLFTGRFPFVWLGNQVQGVDFFFYQLVDPDFQWPQVWRTNLGLDKRFDNGVILTADVAYTKDINAAHVQNWGLNNPSATLNGVDNRAVYTNEDKAQIFGGPTNAYVFTNSDQGRIINASLKAQKTWENGLYAQLAYSFLNAKEVNSVDAEITGDAFAGNAIVGNANTDVLSFSRYGDTHRFIGVLSKEFKKTGTTISTFFEYAKSGRYNYIYGGDINNDGSSINDLLYIPTQSEVSQMNFEGPGQAEAFEAFIQQDDYLNDRRGEYAERYGALAPWRGRWDVKILQDIKINDKNKFQLSLDILNAGNLITSKWGLVQEPAFDQVLGVTVDENNIPTYSFDPNRRETFAFNTGALSRWRAQIGVRYIFN